MLAKHLMFVFGQLLPCELHVLSEPFYVFCTLRWDNWNYQVKDRGVVSELKSIKNCVPPCFRDKKYRLTICVTFRR
jgi:hypothetical protein